MQAIHGTVEPMFNSGFVKLSNPLLGEFLRRQDGPVPDPEALDTQRSNDPISQINANILGPRRLTHRITLRLPVVGQLLNVRLVQRLLDGVAKPRRIEARCGRSLDVHVDLALI